MAEAPAMDRLPLTQFDHGHLTATQCVAPPDYIRASMKQTTDSPTDEPHATTHLEIADFEITLSNGLCWISYGSRHYPVTLTPYHFKRLFEIEGTPIENFTGGDPLRFSKAILLRWERNLSGDLFDEEGGDITPQPCWVKEVSGADTRHP